MRVGFYSIIRFVEDLDREEPLNVGAVIEVEGDVRVRFVDRPALNGSRDVIQRFEETLVHLLDANVTDPEAPAAASRLEALALRRFPHFAFSAPRTIMVDDVDEALYGVTHRLVEEPAHGAFA
jgi:hypothetical protein